MGLYRGGPAPATGVLLVSNLTFFRHPTTSTRCGLLAATALLLDAATEDSTTENILKSMSLYSR